MTQPRLCRQQQQAATMQTKTIAVVVLPMSYVLFCSFLFLCLIEQSSDVNAMALMEDILDKLKLLDYERKFCRAK